MAYIDIERLRCDMEDYYGTGAFGGFPAMFLEVNDIKNASDEELIRMAKRDNINFAKYYRI